MILLVDYLLVLDLVVQLVLVVDWAQDKDFAVILLLLFWHDILVLFGTRQIFRILIR